MIAAYACLTTAPGTYHRSHPALARPVAEVDVLDVVAIAGVPATDLLEHRASLQQECAQHPIGLHGLVRPLVEKVVVALALVRRVELAQRGAAHDRPGDGREAAARRLPRAVGPEHLRPGDAAARPRSHEPRQRCDRTRVGNRVRDSRRARMLPRSAAIPVFTFAASVCGRAFSITRTPSGYRCDPAWPGRFSTTTSSSTCCRSDGSDRSSSAACRWETTTADTLTMRSPRGRRRPSARPRPAS